MVDVDKFNESVKDWTFYKEKRGNDLPQAIIDDSKTVKFTAKMAKYHNMIALINAVQVGDFAGILDDFVIEVPKLNKSVDGWNINKAIQAEGERATKDAEASKSFLNKLGL